MKKTKNRFLPGFFCGMLAMAVVIAGIGTGIYFTRDNSKNISVSEDTARKSDYIEKIIDNYYLDKVDKTNLENGVYKGLVSGLGDPYSVYYTAEEFKSMMEDSSGKYYGIGTLVSQNAETGVITAIKVFENAPADKAGMKNGDLLYKVEGEEVTGQDLNKVVAKMKGNKGTQVKITVFRESENKYIDLQITRDEVNVPTVSHKMLDKKQGIGYIEISQFEEVTYKQFTSAIEDLKKQGMRAVIFDVRSNPGGIYDTVCKMLDYILPRGTIVYTKDKYGNKQEETSDADCLNITMVVLQNKESASASEIFAGAIQDFKAGKIIGTQSFGKGIVQSIIPLNDGTAVKLTVQKYYTPGGRNIHGTGITPDIKVENKDTDKKDTQLIKAEDTIKDMLKKK